MVNTIGGKWGGTFQWWDTYPPSEVREVEEEELGDYESDYMRMFNTLREAGWFRESGKWNSPCGKWAIQKIDVAYNRHRLEWIAEREDEDDS